MLDSTLTIRLLLAVSKKVIRVGRRMGVTRLLHPVDEHTVMLADFLRCGVGWIRFTVATVLHYHCTGEFRKLSYNEMYTYTPTLTGREKEYRPFYFNGRDHLLKTHYDFDPNFKRAIVIYRNPFDAIQSAYANDLMDAGGTPFPSIGSLTDEESYLVQRCRQYVRFHESWLSQIRSHPDRYLKMGAFDDSYGPLLSSFC